MLSEMTGAHDPIKTLPSNSGPISDGTMATDPANVNGNGRPHSKSLNAGPNMNPNFPPPKTDKPRPHICATCTRSFARLEHLKRHERSHTKEKPFACPECTRCFARRDLLLRHQQKLHMTALPSSRQRGTRRESTSSAAPGGSTRVRKNSMANSASNSSGNSAMRPRANTISHVDNTTLGMLAAANSSASRQEMGLGLGNYSAMGGLPGASSYHPRGMASAAGHHGNPHVLPKLETRNHGIDVGVSLRTAPPFGGFGGEMDMESLWFGSGSTVNPAQLHYSNSPNLGNFDEQASYHQGLFSQSAMENDGSFGWLNTFDNQMSFNNNFNEHAIDGSSPSANSTGSPGDMSEVMLDGSNKPSDSSSMWQNSMMSQAPYASAYAVDLSGPPFPEYYPTSQLSPKSLNTHTGSQDQYFSSHPPMPPQTPLSMLPGLSSQYFHPLAATSETPSNSAASISSSHRQSSVTSVSTDSITDATRQALLASLAQPSAYGHNGLKTSQPPVFSPLSPEFPTRSRSISNVPLPSTYDLQRYVAAYVQYFHPHLPFLHIPSLSFNSPAFTSNLRASSGQLGFGQSGIAGGGGSLVLAMAAIGALYEYDISASRELFEMAKKMIQLYLEERRKADMSAALNGNHNDQESSAQNTPLWLVQAMLLNVIYGHNCGDKTLAGIASTHCAALVNLARAADLAKPLQDTFYRHAQSQRLTQEDVHVGAEETSATPWNGTGNHSPTTTNEWLHWKIVEERKRTLYAVFILSSLCVSAYNHAPALMNSEIGLDLPCDEALWSADSVESWHSLGGAVYAEHRNLSFASALSSLLTASQRVQQRHHQIPQPFDQSSLVLENLPESDIKPSTFGCLVLINALHNYIWETRQRHMGRKWTTQETEAMHAHIEPALRAWLAAWATHPEHSVERPNPFGASSLSADCIPYLDLAYLRLFVNLGRSKEAFFRRDFDSMAEELARGTEIVQHADSSTNLGHSDSANASSTSNSSPRMEAPHAKIDEQLTTGRDNLEQPSQGSGPCTKRERHLRKAANYAVNALAMSDTLGVSFADYTSRELPLQSGLCAFDCAQVLAEWVSTVQQRVGRYLGVLGRDSIDFNQVPAIMLLEDEDLKLFEKIEHILTSAETKLANVNSMASMAPTPPASSPSMEDSGYGSKILLVHARMFEKAAVWPLTREMCQSLRIQAAHMRQREEASLHTTT